MHMSLRSVALSICLIGAAATARAQERNVLPAVASPTDVKPGSITCDECPYPYPSTYLDINVYGQDVRISYMDVAPQGARERPHGAAAARQQLRRLLFQGDHRRLSTREGFRVIVPDQIGYGRSSKPIVPYNLQFAGAQHLADPRRIEKIEKVMVVGHSMGGMLAARFATQYPKSVERVVLYNPIGLTDGRFGRPMTPIDESYQQTLEGDYQSIRAGLSRYVAHNPAAWNAEFENYTRIRYSWTLSSDWPRLAMVQSLIGQMLYFDPVVYDWPHIQVPTLAFGGADDLLLGTAASFQERMEFLARSIPNGKGRVLLLPGLGHVPHLEAPDRVLPPLVAFLKEGVTAK